MLGYQVHADLLKNIILNDKMLPISIGVFGNWGSGKSSLMLLLEEGIEAWKKQNAALDDDQSKKDARILQVRFNSWQFEDYSSTKLIMIETILEALSKDISDRKDLFEKCDDFLARISFMKAGVFLLKKAYDKFVPENIKEWLPNEEELNKITGKEDYVTLMEDVKKGNNSKFVEQFRSLFETMIRDADYKAVIVYVDDLDRCDPKRIIDCLEAVKLFVNVDRTAFVIGADERIIEYAISLHYPIKQEKEEISSPFSDYLEKLIQLPYKLPRLSDTEQETYLTLLLCQEKLTDANFRDIHKKYVEFRTRDKYTKFNIDDIKREFPNVNFHAVEYMLPILPVMKQFLNGNPRQLKRFLNTVSVRLQLADVAGFTDIKPEVLVKLMVLEYNSLYTGRFEDLYVMQSLHGGVIDMAEVEDQARNADTIEHVTWKQKWDSDYLKRWLASEPSLAGVALRNYFWISRDALKNQTPVASLVTSRIRLIYKGIITLMTAAAVKKDLPDMVKNLDAQDKDLIVRLMNETMINNPTDESLWRILCCPESDQILEDNKDRLASLFENVRTSDIDLQSHTFFDRLVKKGEDYKELVKSLNLSARVSRALKLQE